jgi:uncharacterized RDD family membrane protein YckC
MSDDRVSFETPEDVALTFDLAGPGSRAAAALVDYLLISGVVFALLAMLIGAGVLAFSFRDLFNPEALKEMSGFAVAVLIAAVFAVNLFYFVACEHFLSGQSVGKRALGLRVVRDGGYAVSFSASLVRNVLRIVDMLPGPYFVGLLSVTLSKERRRLGDFVAGTLVIRQTPAEAPAVRFPGVRYSTLADRQFVLTREQIAALSADALVLLDGYFDRAEKLEDSQARALCVAVANGIAARMGISFDGDPLRAKALLEETYLALREHLAG